MPRSIAPARAVCQRVEYDSEAEKGEAAHVRTGAGFEVRAVGERDVPALTSLLGRASRRAR